MVPSRQLQRALICALLATACERAESTTAHLALPPAEWSIATPFTFVSSARILSGDRVLVTDGREGRVVLAGLHDGTLVDVGRRGNGPSEWVNVFPLIPLSGDTSIMVDPAARRWTILAGAEFERTLPPDHPLVARTGGPVVGVDARWNAYRVLPPNLPARGGDFVRGARDSIPLVRFSGPEAVADTMAWLRDAIATVEVAMRDGQPFALGISRPAFSVGEQTAIWPDGAAAIVRFDPYRTDWKLPGDSAWLRGAAIETTTGRVDETEREFYRSRHAEEVAQLDRAPEIIRRLRMRRYEEFPELLPPIEPSALLAGLDGCLYVLRTPEARRPQPRYDIVDRRGVRLAQLVLPSGSRLTFVNANSWLIVATDSVGLETVSLHRRSLASAC